VCAVVGGGTLWLQKYRPETQLLEDVAPMVTELLDEVNNTLFLRTSPPPDPEAVSRFKDAIDRELQRLSATRQQATDGNVTGPTAEPTPP
jgi:hypothetical protein